MNNKVFYQEIIQDNEGMDQQVTVTDKMISYGGNSISLKKVNNVSVQKYGVPFPKRSLLIFGLALLGLIFLNEFGLLLNLIFILVMGFCGYNIYFWTQNNVYGSIEFITSAGQTHMIFSSPSDFQKLNKLHTYILEAMAEF